MKLHSILLLKRKMIFHGTCDVIDNVIFILLVVCLYRGNEHQTGLALVVAVEQQ